MNRSFRLRIAMVAVATCGIGSCRAGAQSVPQQVVPELVQQAQTLRIPLTAIHRQTLLPVINLAASDLSLQVDGQPHAFQLSRPWSATINPKTGQPEDRPNLLIILPLDGPLYRKNALNEAIDDFSKQPDLGWNISILDDAGNQTPYTRDLKTVIANLQKIKSDNPGDISLDEWRQTATVAIGDMRDLPGRRVVMSLGDIFHEMAVEGGQLVYENFEVNDVAAAARNAGAVIYAAESSSEINGLRGIFPYYSLAGSGPWLLLSRTGELAGWISGSVAATVAEIRRDGVGAYDIDLHLGLKQMDGHIHLVSVTPRQPSMLLDAPAYYIAPNLAELRQLAAISPALRNALRHLPAPGASPLEMATQLAYFPHADRRSGTQIATTGFFWTGTKPHPAQLQTALQLQETSSGLVVETTIATLDWNSATRPIWNFELPVVPGVYRLRVAAADAAGKIAAGTDTSFTVEPTTDEPVLVSSLVLGKSCVFNPQPPAGPDKVDFLRAGNCDLQPDPSRYYSPRDIVWTLVRVTPTGKLAGRPPKDWKSSFLLIDGKGHKLAEQRVQWLPAGDGSFVASGAFPLENPKLKLENAEYAIVFRLKGPGIESDYQQIAPFMVYGVPGPASESKQ